MTRDDIIRMAREAGLQNTDGLFKTVYVGTGSDLERFAALVAAAAEKSVMNRPINKAHWQRFEDEVRAAEREECAKYLEHQNDGVWANTCASAIRARGQA